MGMRIRNVRTVGHRPYIYILEKWFPLQGERAQSLKVYNINMSVFKNNIIDMRKRR